MLRTILAFFIRDFQTETSYRFAFVLSLTGVFFSSFTYFFMSQLLGDSVVPSLATYSDDYFSFVIIGVAFGSYFSLGLNGFSRALRQAQTTGTLEAMMMTPTSVSTIILGSATWSYAFTSFRVLIYLALGSLLGLRLDSANYLGGIITMALSIMAFASIGIIAASIIMVLKRGDPVASLLGTFSGLIGGVLYPIEILPEWLQVISKILPITYALQAMRLALLRGATLAELTPDLLVLLGYCVVFFPISLLIFRYAVDRARQDGSLAHY